MSHRNSRRDFLRASTRSLGGAAALSLFPPVIRKALAIEAHRRTGTIQDVEHIVVFTQENRSFDHYFGTMPGVRGFADRFPIPVVDGPGGLHNKTVWYQRNAAPAAGSPAILTPQRNDTTRNFSLIRTADTPHLYPDAQDAWSGGRMTNWPQYKRNASMVYYAQPDVPFQFALAQAFTLCDAYYSSFTGGTNPNRCYVYTGTNHGRAPAGPAVYNGPALDNSYNTLAKGAIQSGYTWMTYAECLEDAGVSWQVYQSNEVEFYALNPLYGFKAFREANAASVPTVAPQRTPRQQALYEKGIKSRDLDMLKADVMAGRLPQVSWICATQSGCEHPSTSSPAQGAAYVTEVLEALTSNPEVWSKTVLILNYDENDGFFDHMPPPAPPSYVDYDHDPHKAVLAGASSVDASDEYLGDDVGGIDSANNYRHHPYGLGPRVPAYVISPWSKGGWINSEVFDHTSTLRFIERRFGVKDPNTSAWRRAVAGDLSSCFDFGKHHVTKPLEGLPDTRARDAQSRALAGTVTPVPSATPVLPVQLHGIRPSRALPYELHVHCDAAARDPHVALAFSNTGSRAAVFHVYDRKHLDRIPRRYTVEAGKELRDVWDTAADGGFYDLWVLAPNGFHRHYTGSVAPEHAGFEVKVGYDRHSAHLHVQLLNDGAKEVHYVLKPNAYSTRAHPGRVRAHDEAALKIDLESTRNWYDFTLTVEGLSRYSRRFAGRLEDGRDGVSDPAMGGAAIGDQIQIA
jgi:phospholipase C